MNYENDSWNKIWEIKKKLEADKREEGWGGKIRERELKTDKDKLGKRGRERERERERERGRDRKKEGSA